MVVTMISLEKLKISENFIGKNKDAKVVER